MDSPVPNRPATARGSGMNQYRSAFVGSAFDPVHSCRIRIATKGQSARSVSTIHQSGIVSQLVLGTVHRSVYESFGASFAGSNPTNRGAIPPALSIWNGLPSSLATTIVPSTTDFSASIYAGVTRIGRLASAFNIAICGAPYPSKVRKTFASFSPGVPGTSSVASNSTDAFGAITVPARMFTSVHLQLGTTDLIVSGCEPRLRITNFAGSFDPGLTFPKFTIGGSIETGAGGAVCCWVCDKGAAEAKTGF